MLDGHCKDYRTARPLTKGLTVAQRADHTLSSNRRTGRGEMRTASRVTVRRAWALAIGLSLGLGLAVPHVSAQANSPEIPSRRLW